MDCSVTGGAHNISSFSINHITQAMSEYILTTIATTTVALNSYYVQYGDYYLSGMR